MVSYIDVLDKHKKLKEHLTKYAKNLIKTKENKLTRDNKAYDYEQAYKWTHQGTHPRFRGQYSQGPQATNLDLIESDTSSLSSASYVPIGTRFDGTCNASKKRKNEVETGSHGQSKTAYASNKDKRSHSHRSQNRTTPNIPMSGSVLNHSLMSPTSPTVGINSVSLPAGPLSQQMAEQRTQTQGASVDIRTTPIFHSSTLTDPRRVPSSASTHMCTASHPTKQFVPIPHRL